MRALFLQEINAQVRYDAAHTRPGATPYIIRENSRDIGYGSVKDTQSGAGTIFEFYLLPIARQHALGLLGQLVEASRADALECQSNDRFYAPLVKASCGALVSDTILFAPGELPELPSGGAVFRRRRRTDKVFRHEVEPVGDFVIDMRNEVVATGGFLLHYNPPFADVFMEVRPDARRRGFGAMLVRQLIAECYFANRVPAARTGVDNLASQATLGRAGFVECARMQRGELVRSGVSG